MSGEKAEGEEGKVGTLGGKFNYETYFQDRK